MRKELHKALSDGVPSVGKRVYPLTMPQDTKHKCLVYRVIGSQETTGITCVDPINTRYGIQIDCLAPTYAESVELMEKVKSILRANFLTFNFISFEDYLNITLKYRQVIDVQLELRPVFTTPTPPAQPIIVNHGVPVVDHGIQVIP